MLQRNGMIFVLAVSLAGGCGGGTQGSNEGGTDGSNSGGDATLSDGRGIDSGIDASHNDGSGNGSDTAGSDGTASDAATSNHVVMCPGCPCFPGTNCSGTGGPASDSGTPPACTTSGEAPTLVYPPDQVLLPPNTAVVEIQFMPGTGNQIFEIDFENSVTDVRIITQCNPITNSLGMVTGGCGFTLDATNWSYVADVNRGGDPVQVTVRATPDGVCVGGSNSRNILFSTQDLNGGIYYWQSAVVNNAPGRAGGIYRYDFGVPSVAPEAFLESSPTTGNRCIGCHFVSRDGSKISYGSDDPDSDDEYSDLQSNLMDIATRDQTSSMISPGFRTFTHDHAYMLASDGRAMNNPPALNRYDANTGTMVDRQTTGGARGTQPDWSADDSHVVYVQPQGFLLQMPGPGGQVMTSTTMGDDNHFFGGSLMVAPWNGTTLGAATPLLMSSGENNYYPAYSPDGAFVVFNRVTQGSLLTADAYSNPNARIWAIPSGGGNPVDLAQLNGTGALSNSWPRWSPYVQADRGHSILWVTFSSTRDYGLRVQNQGGNGVYCYPPETPENSQGNHNCPLIPPACQGNMCMGDAAACPQFCMQPQIWMAAVEVDAAGGISTGRDTSHPAFWLPFQSVQAHNHIAQWVESIPGQTAPDAGVDASTGGADAADVPATDGSTPACGEGNAPCGTGLPLCCAAYACVSGSCGVP